MFKPEKRKLVIFCFIFLLLTSTFSNNINAEKSIVTEYLTKVTLVKIDVYEDNDDGASGEIYYDSTINNQDITSDIIEGINDGDPAIFNDVLYTGWCEFLDVLIEVWDDDAGEIIPPDNIPDSLGAVDEFLNPQNDTLSFETYDYEDSRIESNVTLNLQTINSRIVTKTTHTTGFSQITSILIVISSLLIIPFFSNIYYKKTRQK